jgi:hypothetical protein
VYLFVPNMKMIAESAYQGKLIVWKFLMIVPFDIIILLQIPSQRFDRPTTFYGMFPVKRNSFNISQFLLDRNCVDCFCPLFDDILYRLFSQM